MNKKVVITILIALFLVTAVVAGAFYAMMSVSKPVPEIPIDDTPIIPEEPMPLDQELTFDRKEVLIAANEANVDIPIVDVKANLIKSSGQFNAQEISMSFLGIRASVATCYRNAIVHDRELTGKAIVHFSITESGRLKNLKIEKPTTNDELNKCLEIKLPQWRFPPTTNGETQIELELDFQNKGFKKMEEILEEYNKTHHANDHHHPPKK